MRKARLVYGHGVNDSETPVTKHEKVNGKNKIVWICPLYRVWSSMLCRCYSATHHARFPTYIGCYIVKEWLTFSVFRSWMQSQGWQGMQLDKDILFPGNKVYGPDTCVFVSGALNSFLNDHGCARGEWPIGVCWNKSEGKFIALCSNPDTGKQESQGYFNNPERAHEAWRRRKHEHALRYAEIQTDKRIADALRVRFL